MSIDLVSCLPLPKVLVEIVVEYARPYIVGIMEANFSSRRKELLQSCISLVDALLVFGSMSETIEQLCTCAKVPYKYIVGRATYSQQVEYITEIWRCPDFILHLQSSRLLHNIKLHPGWKEKLVCLNLNCWHSIWDGTTIALYPPAAYLDSDDDYWSRNPIIPRSFQPLPMHCVSWEDELDNIRQDLVSLKQDLNLR